MILTKTLKIRWCNKTKKRYIDKGYVYTFNGDEFEIKIEDLPLGSDFKIECICNMCSKIRILPRKDYKDNCNKCALEILHKDEDFKARNKKAVLEYMNSDANKERVAKIFNDPVKRQFYIDNCKRITKNQRGENHPGWRHDMTEEDRSHDRNHNPLNLKFKISVWKRDDWTCRICNFKSRKGVVAHHLYNYSEHKDLRYRTENGITLCKKCHIEFHSKHGNKYNNPYEYLKFKLWKLGKLNRKNFEIIDSLKCLSNVPSPIVMEINRLYQETEGQ